MTSGPLTNDLDRPLFHTTLVSNLGTICQAGKITPPANSPADFANPWCPRITASRASLPVPVGELKTIDHFVALTGTSRTPAHYNLATGRWITKVPNSRLVHFATTTQALLDNSVAIIVATAQPLSPAATFIEGPGGVSAMDWRLIDSRSFGHDPSDPSKGARVGAEVLAEPSIPLAAVHRVVVWEGEHEIAALLSSFPISAHIDVIRERTLFFPRGA